MAVEQSHHGCSGDGDAQAFELLLHPVERDRVSGPGHHDLGDEARAVAAATVPDPGRAVRYDDVLAAGAGEHLLDVLLTSERRRDELVDGRPAAFAYRTELVSIFAARRTVGAILVDRVLDLDGLQVLPLLLVLLAAGCGLVRVPLLDLTSPTELLGDGRHLLGGAAVDHPLQRVQLGLHRGHDLGLVSALLLDVGEESLDLLDVGTFAGAGTLHGPG